MTDSQMHNLPYNEPNETEPIRLSSYTLEHLFSKRHLSELDFLISDVSFGVLEPKYLMKYVFGIDTSHTCNRQDKASTLYEFFTKSTQDFMVMQAFNYWTGKLNLIVLLRWFFEELTEVHKNESFDINDRKSVLDLIHFVQPRLIESYASIEKFVFHERPLKSEIILTDLIEKKYQQISTLEDQGLSTESIQITRLELDIFEVRRALKRLKSISS